jgi:hypothetical protein
MHRMSTADPCQIGHANPFKLIASLSPLQLAFFFSGWLVSMIRCFGIPR